MPGSAQRLADGAAVLRLLPKLPLPRRTHALGPRPRPRAHRSAPRQASGALPPVPNLQAVLAASSGPRFTELLWRFALLCLRLAWQRECQAQARLGPAEQQPTAALCPPTAAPAAVTEEHVTAAEALLSLELKRRALRPAAPALTTARSGTRG